MSNKTFAPTVQHHVIPGLLLFVVVLIGAGLRAWWAGHDFGVYYPDELYQTLEAGHRVAFGYGLVSWEYVTGLRNWLLPGAIGGVMWLVDALGFHHPLAYLGTLRALFIALQLAGVAAGYWFVRHRGGSQASALTAALIGALLAPLVYFSYRGLSEAIAAPLVLIGWVLATNPWPVNREQGVGNRTKVFTVLGARCSVHWPLVMGVALLALATVIRLPVGIFAAVLLARLLIRRDWRATKIALVTLAAVWLLALGLLDALTWGSWFHSAIEYVRYNVIEGNASGFGVAPVDYYLTTYRSFTGPIALPLLALSLIGGWRARWFGAAVLVYAVVHSLIPHKEFRFMTPVVLGLVPLAALGLDTVVRYSRLAAIGLGTAVFILVTVSAKQLPTLTKTDIGSPPFTDSAFNTNADVNHLLVAAYDAPGLCGLNIDSDFASVWSGGYAYIHRNVPLHWVHPDETGALPFYNYEIRRRGSRAAETANATHGAFELVRLSDGCTAEPSYDFHL